MIEIIVAISVCLAFFGGVGLYFYLFIRDRNRFQEEYNQHFQEMSSLVLTPHIRWVGRETTATFIKNYTLALYCLSFVWPDSVLENLRNTKYIIYDTPSWTDLWGRKVAGLAYPESNTIEVGSDFAALPHEMGELIYTALTGKLDWQLEEWNERLALEIAIEKYNDGKD